jgi:hypothetical protein
MERILAILLITLGLGASLPTWALEFTADRITTIDGRTGKDALFYRDNMWRLEHHARGPVSISIVRKDKRIVWLLLSRIRHFKTVPYSGEQDPMVTEKLEGEVSREEIGQETREGHQTILYEVTTKQGERTEVYYQWLATDIHFPMRLMKKDGSWSVEYQHVKIRTLSDSLFQLPMYFTPVEEDKPDSASEPKKRM